MITALCDSGEYVMEQQTDTYICEPCIEDKYQSKPYPKKGDVCVTCPPTENGVNQGTKVGGAYSSDLCERKLCTYFEPPCESLVTYKGKFRSGDNVCI